MGRQWPPKRNCIGSGDSTSATYANMQDSLHNGRVDSRGSPFLYTLIGLMSSGDYEATRSVSPSHAGCVWPYPW